MAHFYNFAIVRFAPDVVRGEILNVGAVFWNSVHFEIRSAKSLDKIRALTLAVQPQTIQDMLSGLVKLEQVIRDQFTDMDSRVEFLFSNSPVSLSQKGKFTTETSADFELRAERILADYVNTEPALPRTRVKRTGLVSQIKQEFRKEYVLAQKGEDLLSHRILPRVTVDEGLVADFMLKNGKFHVIETVDASSENDEAHKIISGIGISALVLERARMRWGQEETRSILVYSASSRLERVARPSLDAVAHQNAEMVNWQSNDDKMKFLGGMTQLANPYKVKPKKRTSFVQGNEAGFKFH